MPRDQGRPEKDHWVGSWEVTGSDQLPWRGGEEIFIAMRKEVEIRVNKSFNVFSYKEEQRNQPESGGKSDKTRTGHFWGRREK